MENGLQDVEMDVVNRYKFVQDATITSQIFSIPPLHEYFWSSDIQKFFLLCKFRKID